LEAKRDIDFLLVSSLADAMAKERKRERDRVVPLDAFFPNTALRAQFLLIFPSFADYE